MQIDYVVKISIAPLSPLVCPAGAAAPTSCIHGRRGYGLMKLRTTLFSAPDILLSILSFVHCLLKLQIYTDGNK